MPWSTPTLGTIRRLVRDAIAAYLPGADAAVPNSTMRVLSEANAGLAHLVLKYADWIAKQLLPDTAEGPWLNRWANIVLPTGAKPASFSQGTATVTGIDGSVIAAGMQLTAANGAVYQVDTQVTLGGGRAMLALTSTTPGAVGNQLSGARLSFIAAVAGVDAAVFVVDMQGGADAETEDELRSRVLDRLRKPPMGGDADDYVAWALEVPGVTRAWCSPREMGVGTVTVRFMMDDLRADEDGFPNTDDVAAVQAYLNVKRPVTAADCFVVAPVPEPIHFTLTNLDSDDESTLANIEAAAKAMIKDRAAPASSKNGIPRAAQTIYANWISEAVSSASGVDHFDLTMADHAMPTPGSLAVLGNVIVG